MAGVGVGLISVGVIEIDLILITEQGRDRPEIDQETASPLVSFNAGTSPTDLSTVCLINLVFFPILIQQFQGMKIANEASSLYVRTIVDLVESLKDFVWVDRDPVVVLNASRTGIRCKESESITKGEGDVLT